MCGPYSISALWGPRPETPSSLAARWCKAVAELRETDEAFATWFICTDKKTVRELPSDLVELEAAIEGNEPFDSTVGYHLRARSDPGLNFGPNIFSLSVRGGSTYFNSLVLGTDYKQKVDAYLVRYKIFRAAFLIVSETFDAERAYAYPDALIPLWTRPDPRDQNPSFPLAWLSYVAQRSADLVTPPKSAIVERRPSGALFLAATDDTFDVANPAHMAVAHDIEAAVAPLRSRPWRAEPPVS